MGIFWEQHFQFYKALILFFCNVCQVEEMLRENGDFLVRESNNQMGQFVLSGRHQGRIKHLLLVDPEGVVSGPYS